jgi:hypothetical protein
MYASSSPGHSNIAIGLIDISSQNLLKIYQAIDCHLGAHPHDENRFPNFRQVNKTILTRGADGPLEGGTHSAKYFHGR